MPTRLKIKEIATSKGWTQSKLQRAADVHSRTMTGIYQNPFRDVAYSTLQKIAKVLEVGIEDLVEEVPEEKPEDQKGV